MFEAAERYMRHRVGLEVEVHRLIRCSNVGGERAVGLVGGTRARKNDAWPALARKRAYAVEAQDEWAVRRRDIGDCLLDLVELRRIDPAEECQRDVELFRSLEACRQAVPCQARAELGEPGLHFLLDCDPREDFRFFWFYLATASIAKSMLTSLPTTKAPPGVLWP